METAVSEAYLAAGHYHDASSHGLAWASLNELLHVIVFVYTLYGMINFRVKFIHMMCLVNGITKLLIVHNWYLSVKFGLLAFVMYVYNIKLELNDIPLASLNCSFGNFALVMPAHIANAQRAPSQDSAPISRTQDESTWTGDRGTGGGGDLVALALAQLNWAHEMLEGVLYFEYMPHFNWFLDRFGGPFKWLGNRATLMYGFYSLAIYAMLAIFPLELMYFVEVGFNFIRFVLSDPACMSELYQNRRRHMDRLSSWSRNQTSSLQTRAIKMSLSQRDLRANYAGQWCGRLTAEGRQGARAAARTQSPPDSRTRALWALPARLLTALDRSREAPIEAQSRRCQAADAQRRGFRPEWHNEWARADGAGPQAGNVDRATGRIIGGEWARRLAAASGRADSGSEGRGRGRGRGRLRLRLRRRAGLRRFDGWGAQVGLATSSSERALEEARRRATMEVRQLSTRSSINHCDSPDYQMRLAMANLDKFKPFVRSESWFKASMVIYPIYIFFYFFSLLLALASIQYYAELSLARLNEACGADSPANSWSPLDHLIYYESIYTVFTLACASSFYCSYYFGTILELSVWLKEIAQQLELCTQLIGLNHQLLHSEGGIRAAVRHLESDPELATQLARLDARLNDFGGLVQLFPDTEAKLRHRLGRLRSFLADLVRMRNLAQWLMAARGSLLSVGARPRNRGYDRVRMRELMALRLLTKKATLLRATYVNMCLFFDEHNETHFMTSTILKRTVLIASGFAFMVSITRSQFKANYWQLISLLLAAFFIFNLYLACAAYINSGINKMIVQIHSLIAASMRTGCEDAHLMEFWLRHVNSFGEDKDVMAYSFYGYKVAWSSILNVDSFITSVYLFTHN